MPTETVTIFKDRRVTIDVMGNDNHAKRNVNVYVEKLINAVLKVDYNMISGGNSFNVVFNNHKVIDDVYCGWGGCKDTIKTDVTDYLVNGTNTFDLHFFKAPFWHPGAKEMIFSSYLIIEYEGQPPEQPKKMNVVLLRGERIDLGSFEGRKSKRVTVTALWDNAKTKILNTTLKTVWEVNTFQMACDIYWNGEKVHDYYCGVGQCSDSRKSVVQLLRGVNELLVDVHKTSPIPWGSTTIITAILEVTYVGDKPLIRTSPPLPDWITWVKYGAIVGGCALGGYVIAKGVRKSEGRKKSRR